VQQYGRIRAEGRHRADPLTAKAANGERDSVLRREMAVARFESGRLDGDLFLDLKRL